MKFARKRLFGLLALTTLIQPFLVPLGSPDIIFVYI